MNSEIGDVFGIENSNQARFDGIRDSQRFRCDSNSNPNLLFPSPSPIKLDQKIQLQPPFDYLPPLPTDSSNSSLSQRSYQFSSNPSLFRSHSTSTSISEISTPSPGYQPSSTRGSPVKQSYEWEKISTGGELVDGRGKLAKSFSGRGLNSPYARPRIDTNAANRLSLSISQSEYSLSPLAIDTTYFSPTKSSTGFTQSSPPPSDYYYELGGRENLRATLKRSQSVRGESYQTGENGLKRSQSVRRSKTKSPTKRSSKSRHNLNDDYSPPTLPAELIKSTPMVRKNYDYLNVRGEEGFQFGVNASEDEAQARARYLFKLESLPSSDPIYDFDDQSQEGQMMDELHSNSNTLADLNDPQSKWTPLDELSALPTFSTFVPLYQRLADLSNSIRDSKNREIVDDRVELEHWIEAKKFISDSSQELELGLEMEPYPSDPINDYQTETSTPLLSPYLSPEKVPTNLFLLSSVSNLSLSSTHRNSSSNYHLNIDSPTPQRKWLPHEVEELESNSNYSPSSDLGQASNGGRRDFTYSYKPGTWKVEEEEEEPIQSNFLERSSLSSISSPMHQFRRGSALHHSFEYD